MVIRRRDKTLSTGPYLIASSFAQFSESQESALFLSTSYLNYAARVFSPPFLDTSDFKDFKNVNWLPSPRAIQRFQSFALYWWPETKLIHRPWSSWNISGVHFSCSWSSGVTKSTLKWTNIDYWPLRSNQLELVPRELLQLHQRTKMHTQEK